MNSSQIRRITATSGLLTSATVFITIPLYFIYEGAPPLWNVLTRDLVALLTMAFLLIFMTGLSHLVRDADRSFEWVASLAYGAAGYGPIPPNATLIFTVELVEVRSAQ